MILSAHPHDSQCKTKCLGFWREEGYPDLPDPSPYVSRDWDLTERARIALYLQNGEAVAHCRGSSKCRICRKYPLGSRDLSDGVYTWPEGLAHYVTSHAIRPPDEFLEHVREKLAGRA